MGKELAYLATSEHPTGRLACPQCGHDLVRVERRLLDRLFSLISPRHRYRCRVHECQWEGTIRVGANESVRDSAH